MTYSEMVLRLTAAGIDSPEQEAAILANQFCGIPRHELIFRKEEELEGEALEKALSRRENRVPLQYILGKWSFYGLDFEINPSCLCPRPDTETVVDLALELLPYRCKFADIGTGSGCIAVSILKKRTDLTAVLVDISTEALATAKRNAECHRVLDRADFICANALNPNFFCAVSMVDAVVSNPPYIPSGEIHSLEPEVLAEPRTALDGGPDGMLFYRTLTRSSARAGIRLIIYEMGYGQSASLAEIAEKNGYEHACRTDLSGKERAAVLTIKDED